MAVRAHLGWRACPSIRSDFCADVNTCAIVDLCTLVRCLRTQTVWKYIEFCIRPHVKGIGCLFPFFGSNICTSMGQNWPPACVACLREKCQAHAVANVSRSAVKHSPPTWCSTEARHERDPVGPVGWIRTELWQMVCGSHIKCCSWDKFAEGLKIQNKTACYLPDKHLS